MIHEHMPSLQNVLFLTWTTYFLIASLIAATGVKASSPAAPTSVTVHCTGNQAWLTPEFSKEDCLEAGERFQYSDYAMYKDQKLEFFNRGTRRISHRPQITTPRRYTIGTCTIIVALLWDFPDQPPLPPLPGEILPAGPFQKNVIISFQDIYESAQRILSLCYVKPRAPVGWEALARGGSLGVFVMATESTLARNIAMERYGTVGADYSVNLSTPLAGSTVVNPWNMSVQRGRVV